MPSHVSLNLMNVISAYEIEPPGTIGICKGKAMCHTCHCYIQNQLNLPEINELEFDTLSRLSNQKNQ